MSDLADRVTPLRDDEVDDSLDDRPTCKAPGCNRPPREKAPNGRGRPPVYCAEHSVSHHASSAGTHSSGRAPTNMAGARRGADTVAQVMSLAGAGIMSRSPWDGMVMVAQAEPTRDALVEAAEASPALRKSLAALGEVGAYTTLVAALAGTVVPILAGHGLIPVEPLIAWRQTHSGEDPPEGPMLMAQVAAERRAKAAQEAAARAAASAGAPAAA